MIIRMGLNANLHILFFVMVQILVKVYQEIREIPRNSFQRILNDRHYSTPLQIWLTMS